MGKVRIECTQVTEEQAMEDVREVMNQCVLIPLSGRGPLREIKEETAATIAAWYQSPGPVGELLASLASGVYVDIDDVVQDIESTKRSIESLDRNHSDALDCLASYVISKASENQ